MALDCLCVLWEMEWLWHPFTRMHGKCVFPLRYTGRISEGLRAWSACANPELEPQKVQAAHLGAKSSFIYTLKHLPIHATVSMWKYRPGVGYICLTVQANRAGLQHSGRQGQSMRLCPKNINIKNPRVFPTDNVGACWRVELQLTQWRLQHPSILLTVSYRLDFS